MTTLTGALSSNTLFHFTRSFDGLSSILRNNFWPNYCLERIPVDDGDPLENGTPMVCFCDIPLSRTVSHMRQYGKYAIGLTKEWGMRNEVTPVLYTHSKSPIAAGFASLTKQGLQLGIGPINNELWSDVARLMCFIKPYSGEIRREGEMQKVRFYDEREWRWVPNHLTGEWKFGIDPSMFVDGRPPVRESAMLRAAARLIFEPEDIRYIVVAQDEEILPMREALLRIKERYSRQDKLLLTTRLISAQQIQEDF